MQLLSQKHERAVRTKNQTMSTTRWRQPLIPTYSVCSVSFNQRVSTWKITFNSVLSVIGLLVEIYKKNMFWVMMQKQKELSGHSAVTRKKKERRDCRVWTRHWLRKWRQSPCWFSSVFLWPMFTMYKELKRSDFRRLRLSLMTPNAGDEDRFRLLWNDFIYFQTQSANLWFLVQPSSFPVTLWCSRNRTRTQGRFCAVSSYML